MVDRRPPPLHARQRHVHLPVAELAAEPVPLRNLAQRVRNRVLQDVLPPLSVLHGPVQMPASWRTGLVTPAQDVCAPRRARPGQATVRFDHRHEILTANRARNRQFPPARATHRLSKTSPFRATTSTRATATRADQGKRLKALIFAVSIAARTAGGLTSSFVPLKGRRSPARLQSSTHTSFYGRLCRISRIGIGTKNPAAPRESDPLTVWVSRGVWSRWVTPPLLPVACAEGERRWLCVTTPCGGDAR